MINGCRGYIPATGWQIWDTGYAMNSKLARPANTTCDTRGTDGAGANFVTYTWGSITKRSTRALLGDSQSHTLQEAITVAQASFRHLRRINMLMCDLRTVALDEQSCVLSLMDPAAASF